MAPRMRKILFARINRRNPRVEGYEPQETLEGRAFADDLMELARRRQTQAQEVTSTGRVMRYWFAGDMTPSGDEQFMTGTLGYTTREERKIFDTGSYSWVKAETEQLEGASDETVVPFAIDMREHCRWVAFATTPKMRPATFIAGLELVLNAAVLEAGFVPTDWNVDLVVSKARVEEWVSQNPYVFYFERTIKFSNPGRDLDDDRAEMRALAANRKTEQFAAPYGQTLNVDSERFSEKLEGTEKGNLELLLKARGPSGRGEVKFNTRDQADERRIPDFEDLEAGMQAVLHELREYVDWRLGVGPSQPALGE